MNADIAKERSGASFNVCELTHLLDGGKEKTERRRYLESLIHKDPVFRLDDVYQLDRESIYARALKKGVRLAELCKQHNITEQMDYWALTSAIGIGLPFQLHTGMFIPCIKSQGTPAQKSKWLSLADNLQIIGTYAQTEMGHGTYIRGLETRATYDKVLQEFDLHTPSLSACKWWPGNLGKSSTHAVVGARLIIGQKDHGLHFFIVQLRDLKTYEPLPGITVGDIGPKMSHRYNAVDNGYLMMDHVRIPREQMLMRFAQVAPDGTYTKPAHAKASYGTMSYVRAGIVYDSSKLLSMAATIAVRYSAVRRQSELKPGEREPQVIDYKTQQYKVLPAMAASYAFRFAAGRVRKMFLAQIEQMTSGDYSSLPELHVVTSGLKAYASSLGRRLADICRLACGGHGFLLSSGIPELFSVLSASCTYEGENTVLMLQVARFLMKCMSNSADGDRLPPTASYLRGGEKGCRAARPGDFANPGVLIQLFEQRSLRLAKQTGAKLQRKNASGAPAYDTWNELSVDLVRCAEAHSSYLLVLFFLESLKEFQEMSQELRSVLKSVAEFFALYTLLEDSGSLLETGVVNGSQVSSMRDQLYSIMAKLRPDAVALVDAFDHSDFSLNSALGRYDGNVYEELFKRAQTDPLNKQQVLPAQRQYLLPLLQGRHKAKL